MYSRTPGRSSASFGDERDANAAAARHGIVGNFDRKIERLIELRQRGLEGAHRHGGNDFLLDFQPVGWRLAGRSHFRDRHVPAQLRNVERRSDIPADFASLAGRQRDA